METLAENTHARWTNLEHRIQFYQRVGSARVMIIPRSVRRT